jgi:hypothetical protein
LTDLLLTQLLTLAGPSSLLSAFMPAGPTCCLTKHVSRGHVNCPMPLCRGNGLYELHDRGGNRSCPWCLWRTLRPPDRNHAAIGPRKSFQHEPEYPRLAADRPIKPPSSATYLYVIPNPAMCVTHWGFPTRGISVEIGARDVSVMYWGRRANDDDYQNRRGVLCRV